MVGTSLRSVAFRTTSPDQIILRFTYEDLTQDDSEIPSEVAAQVAADFPDFDVDFVVETAAKDVSRALAAGERWVYLRREVLPSDA